MKKYSIVALAIMFALFFNVTTPSVAADKDEKSKAKEVEEKSVKAPQLFIKYNPPKLGKPGNRIGGGTRGIGSDTLTVSALVPDHTALTSKPQPTLCWYMEKPMNMRVEVTLNNDKSVKPVFEKLLAMPDKGGIHCLKLSEFGVTLQTGMEYQWYVAVVPDPEQRSRDIISGGAILYQEEPATLAGKLAKATDRAIPVVYAEEGFWYDALWSLTDLINRNPGDQSLQEMRRDLLNQAGLSEVVKRERKERR